MSLPSPLPLLLNWVVMRPIAAALLLICHLVVASGQLSKPVAHDSNVNTTGNKYLAREATIDVRIATGQQ